MERLEKLLKEKETELEEIDHQKKENERKFVVELDMLKNQHETELLSLQELMKEMYEEKVKEVECSLEDEKAISKELREELEGIRDQVKPAEVTMAQEEQDKLGKEK